MHAVKFVPIRTVNGMNARDGHWRVRHRRVKAERDAVAWVLRGSTKPGIPCVVTLTRCAPSNGLDDDGLSAALKACRDEIAKWLGVDDRHSDIVRYDYAQERGPWGVRIEFRAMQDQQAASSDGHVWTTRQRRYRDE